MHFGFGLDFVWIHLLEGVVSVRICNFLMEVYDIRHVFFSFVLRPSGEV